MACAANGCGEVSEVPARLLASDVPYGITSIECERRLTTTGHIQNREDFFGPGIAEVPTNFWAKWGFEFGAQVEGSCFP
jgi:hypothetical protein